MSKEFTDIPAPFCFPDCPKKELSLSNGYVCADNEVVLTLATISCVHEDACKMWAGQICKNVCKAESCGLKGLTNPVVCIPKN